MDTNTLPGNDAFAVCFVPAVGASLRLSVPLNIGQPLVAQDEAIHLAEVAAAELPAYGFPRGEVLVMRNAAVVQALQTTRLGPGNLASATIHESQMASSTAGSQREVARMALEDLQRQVSRARPTQAAPTAWIACLEQVRRVLASPEEQPERADWPCLTMAELHEQVITLLARFEPDVAGASLTPGQEREPALAS